jgi:hypothetical protein
VVLPLVVIGVALFIHSVKIGHLPLLANAVVPMAACVFGAVLGLGLIYRGWKVTLLVVVLVVGVTLWGMLGGASTRLGRVTEGHLQRLVVSGAAMPPGEARFAALLQAAFASAPADTMLKTAVEQNRAAILAWGIAIGHEKVAYFVGLDRGSALVCQAAALREGTTLRGRDDWARHYALSAALAVLGHPLVSDAGGLMKEQLDALTGGSGFSFGDLMADRAGVRFAAAATASEKAARVMRARLANGFAMGDFFPLAVDLPENLTTEQFRSTYGRIGSKRYRQAVDAIERRLDGCAGLVDSASK